MLNKTKSLLDVITDNNLTTNNGLMVTYEVYHIYTGITLHFCQEQPEISSELERNLNFTEYFLHFL